MLLRNLRKLSQTRCFSSRYIRSVSSVSEVQMLQQLLDDAKAREATTSSEPKSRKGPRFTIGTFNSISPKGLAEFDSDFYDVQPRENMEKPHGILLRSHKLKVSDISPSTRCIARCGAGVNNIPVERMTELGVPVFNTPGANANAVKEAVLCGLLLASRGIVEGINHTTDVIYRDTGSHKEAASRIEKDKKNFVGRELEGKTLGVIGLGHIGGRVVNSALNLGMNVQGFDPSLSLDAAWKLPGDRMKRCITLEELLSTSDYISIHVPYMKETHHMLGGDQLRLLRPNCSIINFARAEIIDSAALKSCYDVGFNGKYISDFADEHMQGHPRMIMLPHLGASTFEAEENSARMAAETIKDFLERGAIRNSVNFPTADLEFHGKAARLCIVNQNVPGVLGRITTVLGNSGLNIAQQINVSRDKIAYTVVDVEDMPKNPEAIQDQLASMDGILSSRFLGNPFNDKMGSPGTFYKVSWKGQ